MDINNDRERWKEEKLVEELQSKLLSTISHELRTPLNSLIQGVDLLLNKDLGRINREQEKFLTIMSKDLSRLTKFINDILDISKIEVGGMRINSASLNVKDITDQVLVSFQAPYKAKHVKLENLVSSTLPEIWGDSHRIAQVLTSLVDNALNFTDGGGTVSVNAVLKSEDNAVEISVTDTGAGIPKEGLSSVFDKFYQLNSNAVSVTRGTRLSLAIAREIIMLHNGKIWVESDENKGSRFIFSIPLSKETN